MKQKIIQILLKLLGENKSPVREMSKLYLNSNGELFCIVTHEGDYYHAIIDGIIEIEGKQCFHSIQNAAETELFIDTEI